MVAHGASCGMDREEKRAAERRKIADKPTILSPLRGLASSNCILRLDDQAEPQPWRAA
jgi:hypothetical protein